MYFSIDKFPEYGRLSGRKLEDNRAGQRVAVDSRKRNTADFALWKVKIHFIEVFCVICSLDVLFLRFVICLFHRQQRRENLSGRVHGVREGRDGISSAVL